MLSEAARENNTQDILRNNVVKNWLVAWSIKRIDIDIDQNKKYKMKNLLFTMNALNFFEGERIWSLRGLWFCSTGESVIQFFDDFKLDKPIIQRHWEWTRFVRYGMAEVWGVLYDNFFWFKLIFLSLIWIASLHLSRVKKTSFVWLWLRNLF